MCIKEIKVEDYTKRHYIKDFQKKYKQAWDITFDTINNMLFKVEFFLITKKLEKIHICETWYIVKGYFKVAWSDKSAKISWNRFIVYIDKIEGIAYILLIYHKGHIIWKHETVWWEKVVKENYKDIAILFDWLK